MDEHHDCERGRHLWVQDEGRMRCLHCGVERRRRRSPLCLVGAHNWVLMVEGDQRYLACRHCGKYGGDPGTLHW